MRIFQPARARQAGFGSICHIFGSHCAFCARPGQAGIDLCAACQAHFRQSTYTSRLGVTTSLCPGCGVPQTSAGPRDDDFCPECIGQRGQFLRHIVAPYRYEFPVDAVLKRLKYRQDRQLARVLGTLLAGHASRHRRIDLPELLLPMPLHSARLRDRGFNQANDIARWCAHRLGVSVDQRLVQRINDTGSLAGLNRAERQHRILGAFRAEDALQGRRVAIVDDVLTTGASARELAREIYDSGADSVELWVFARTSSSRTSG